MCVPPQSVPILICYDLPFAAELRLRTVLDLGMQSATEAGPEFLLGAGTLPCLMATLGFAFLVYIRTLSTWLGALALSFICNSSAALLVL